MKACGLLSLGFLVCGLSVCVGQRKMERLASPVIWAEHRTTDRGPEVNAVHVRARRGRGGMLIDAHAGSALPVAQQAAPEEACRRIFGNIERGIGLGLVEAFASHFAGQVSVTLPGGGAGTYSARQAGLVLESFFKTRRLSGFRFTTFGESDANPYATGSVTFNFKGSRAFAQVYVSLSYSGGRWVITQMNIY